MNRPNLVRRIYAELRSVVDTLENDLEILRVASRLSDAYHVVTEDGHPDLPNHTGGVPFDRWALDRAIADGGWRVLRYESELARGAFEDHPGSDAIAIKEWMMENAA